MKTSALEGEWNVTAVNGKAVQAEQLPYVGFAAEDNRVYGNAGCNFISGTYRVKGKTSKIQLGHMASTMMACPNMELEQSVLEALNGVERIDVTDADHLLLQDGGKNTLLQLEKRFRIVPLADIRGEWRIVSVFGEKMPVMEEVPAVNFDIENNRLSAYAGCNRLSAGFEPGEKNTLNVGQVMSTRMACPDMTTEQNVTTALVQVKSFGVDLNGHLLLFSAGGQKVMELMRNL
ncbi:MAG: META domain-containing protein [Bacteroidaceae bacterium]|nr:META domain-containing protein [Bacteroidaceae bacterium]